MQPGETADADERANAEDHCQRTAKTRALLHVAATLGESVASHEPRALQARRRQWRDIRAQPRVTLALVILYRSPKGALAYSAPSDVTFGRHRVSVDELRAGKLDPVLLDAFGLVPLVEARARLEIAVVGYAVEDRSAEHAGRPRVKRRWDYTPEDPRRIWIDGRTVSAGVGATMYEAPFEVHAATGFPAELAERLGAEAVAEVDAAVAALAPLPCMCHTGVFRMDQHGSLGTLATMSDPRAQFDTQASVALCSVCNQGWTFASRSDADFNYTYEEHAFEPTFGFSEEEVLAILGDLRAGHSVTVGKSRGATTWLALPDGSFRIDESEDNSGTETPLTENQMRGYIAQEPTVFIDSLRRPLRPQLRDALWAATTPETRAAARAKLAEFLAYGPSLGQTTDLLDAVLAWPEEKPSAEQVAAMFNQDRSGNDLYHAIVSAVGYGSLGPETAEFGLRFLQTCVAMMGSEDTFRDLRRNRATFYAMKGDHRSAVADLEWELAHRAPDAWDRDSIADELARAKEKLSAA